MIGFSEIKKYNPITFADFQQARFGLAYYTSLDVEDDNQKLSHFVRSDRSSKWYEVDFTPYNYLTQDDLFQLAGMIDQIEEFEITWATSCEFD